MRESTPVTPSQSLLVSVPSRVIFDNSQVGSGGAGALARGPTPWSGLVKLLLNLRFASQSRTRASGAVQADRPKAVVKDDPGQH